MYYLDLTWYEYMFGYAHSVCLDIATVVRTKRPIETDIYI